jgi:hypothetical protein
MRWILTRACCSKHYPTPAGQVFRTRTSSPHVRFLEDGSEIAPGVRSPLHSFSPDAPKFHSCLVVYVLPIRSRNDAHLISCVATRGRARFRASPPRISPSTRPSGAPREAQMGALSVRGEKTNAKTPRVPSAEACCPTETERAPCEQHLLPKF